MNKRIKNKKAKQARIIMHKSFMKKQKEYTEKFVVGGQVTAYFSNPELSKMMQEKQQVINDAIRSMLVAENLLGNQTPQSSADRIRMLETLGDRDKPIDPFITPNGLFSKE